MSDGDFSKSEMILFSRMLSSLGYYKNSFKPYFDTISLKNKHSVFGTSADTSGGEMTPTRALVVSMLYMMSVDGEMAKEEIGQINVVLRGSKNILPEILKYVKRTKFPDFMNGIIPVLNHQQKSCILVNVADCMLSDGRVNRLEQDLFRRILAGFGVSEAHFKKHFSHLAIKNDRPVDIRKASKAEKKGVVIRNSINTDDEKKFADAGKAAPNKTIKVSPTFGAAAKMAHEIVNQFEQSVDAFESQAASSGGLDVMAANARASESNNISGALASPSKNGPHESDTNQPKKSGNTSAAAGSCRSAASGPMDECKHRLNDAQGVAETRNLHDSKNGEADTRQLRDPKNGEVDAPQLRDANGGVPDKRNLRDAEGGASDQRNLRDVEAGQSDSRRLRDGEGEGDADIRRSGDAEGDADMRRLHDSDGASDIRSSRDAGSNADMRHLRDGEGDSDIRSARDGKGDSDRRRLRDAEGEADGRQQSDAEATADTNQLRDAKARRDKRHLRDAEGESDLRQSSDGDGDVDLRAAEDTSAGAKSRNLRDAASAGGKKLSDSDYESDVVTLQDGQGTQDSDSHLHVRMDYLKSWTGSLKDNLDEFESIDARHTDKRATALEMVTIRPDRPAVLALAVTNSSIPITAQARQNDIVNRPLARNFDMTERTQQIANESAIAPGVDKTRKALAAVTTGLIITQGFSSYGLSEA